MAFLNRPLYLTRIAKALKTHSVVALLGPRQCGKTTLARTFLEKGQADGKVSFFDLEDPADLAILENPKLALEPLNGIIVIDEIQRVPELFQVLRVLVDQPQSNRKFLILGSASRDLIHQSSETLAGRIAYIEITPFSLNEVSDLNKLWLRGGYPKSYLADSEEDSAFWRQQYVSTFLERDIPNLGIHIAAPTLRRFWMMIAHYHGQTFNASEISRSLGIADTTARHYLDILTGAFMVRQLTPWFANLKKRQVKATKLYFRDSGLFHTLSGIESEEQLRHFPKVGASWEGFALEQVIRVHSAEPEECYFWAIHGQAELDLLILKGGRRLGFEFKYKDAPRMTTSMKAALESLELDSLTIVYPGKKNYALGDKVQVRGTSLFHENSVLNTEFS